MALHHNVQYVLEDNSLYLIMDITKICHFDLKISLETVNKKVSHLKPERMCIVLVFCCFWFVLVCVSTRACACVNTPCRLLVKKAVFHALMYPLQANATTIRKNKKVNQTKDSQAQTR